MQQDNKSAVDGITPPPSPAPTYTCVIHTHTTQVMQDDRYLQAAQRLAVVLQTQTRQRHPYAAAADEFELAVNSRLLVAPAQGTNQRAEQRAAARAEL